MCGQVGGITWMMIPREILIDAGRGKLLWTSLPVASLGCSTQKRQYFIWIHDQPSNKTSHIWDKLDVSSCDSQPLSFKFTIQKTHHFRYQFHFFLENSIKNEIQIQFIYFFPKFPGGWCTKIVSFKAPLYIFVRCRKSPDASHEAWSWYYQGFNWWAFGYLGCLKGKEPWFVGMGWDLPENEHDISRCWLVVEDTSGKLNSLTSWGFGSWEIYHDF